jgi:hypothetical protein
VLGPLLVLEVHYVSVSENALEITETLSGFFLKMCNVPFKNVSPHKFQRYSPNWFIPIRLRDEYLVCTSYFTTTISFI